MKKIYENYDIFWNLQNNTPKILNRQEDALLISSPNFKYATSDMRPVFLEEKHLLINLCPDTLDESFYFKSVWATKQGKYIVDGDSFDFSLAKRSKEVNIQKLREKINSFNPSEKMVLKEFEHLTNFVNENREHLNYLLKSEEKDSEGHFLGAYPFIREIKNKYANRLSLISFSGGKDSTVVSHLVRKALNEPSVLHIFGDTTIEYPLTYEYIERFKEKNIMTPFFDERNEENNFFELCEEIGPPSRVKSWCCSIFKTGPMGTTLANFDENILTFIGLRRSESVSRSKYDKVAKSPKIAKQMVACPIIDWLDADVWLYILSENIDFNFAYRQGFARVGCWVCPQNSSWAGFLSSVYIPEKFDKWYNFLIEFSKRIGKEDYEDYVKDGKWKARQGGHGLEKSHEVILEAKECINEDNSKNYKLTKEINDEFIELFKPFGNLSITTKAGLKQILVLKKLDNSPLIKISFRENSREVKVTNIGSTDRYIFNWIEKQLNKFNTCLYCQGCNSACPTGALNVSNKTYVISEKKCTACGKCIDKFDSGCLIASALKIKKGE